ncbi:signal peptidase I [Fodinibius salinus]|uniref:Signal peptidase I n=1 Tax=Fodinibius salinus TaxID=860790 RepID=A0A5D3YJD9_9BACT|nr:signal peptidase I [Fodinibius salinus]TYP93628.1 signal peptidase I [Fodinibius salinus]
MKVSNRHYWFSVRAKKLVRWLKLIGAIVIISWLCKALLFSVYYVPTQSMSPTIQPNSYIIVLKFPYRLHTPAHWPLTNVPFPDLSINGIGNMNHNDIVVFEDPVGQNNSEIVSKRNLVKRCVGLPGDTIQIYLAHTTLNSQIIDHKHNVMINTKSDTLLKVFAIPQKKSNSYFMLGDNRTQSFDSRYFGLVPQKNLIGRAEAKIWPWPPKWL